MQRKGILSERKVCLQEGEYEKFQSEIFKRKWDTLANLLNFINEGIIKEFYANVVLEAIGATGKKSFVKVFHVVNVCAMTL
ncbi:hypothetical protein E2542_SST30053 [Spatholobus suberectus]|nr:hypothetical protein E2542_SST30053 [Spatholobus suberectus]